MLLQQDLLIGVKNVTTGQYEHDDVKVTQKFLCEHPVEILFPDEFELMFSGQFVNGRHRLGDGFMVPAQCLGNHQHPELRRVRRGIVGNTD